MAKKKDHDGGFSIGGDVNTSGGDFIGRDKVVKGGDNSVVIGGNATDNTIVIGNSNVIGNSAGGSLEELLALLREMQALLPQAGLDEDTVEAIEGDFVVMEKQLAKPEPKKAIVLHKLQGVAGMLAAAAATGEAVQKLGPMVQQAIAWAKMLF